MKFKKSKWLKVLSLTGALGVVVATPIISTSCSLKDLTDLINKTLGNNEIKVNQSVTLNGSYDELFKNADKNVSKLLTQNIQSLIGNFADIQKYFDGVEIKTDLGSLIKTNFLDQFEQTNTNAASSSIESVLYSSSLSDLEISSISELKTKVGANLNNILTTSDSNKFNSSFQASLVQDSKVVYDASKGIFGLKVSVTSDTAQAQKTDTQYLLEIPFSKANIKLSGFTVKVSAPKIDLLTIKNLTVIYKSGAHIGQAQYEFKRSPIAVSNSEPTVDDILTGMGWMNGNTWNQDLMFKDANLFNVVVVGKKINDSASKQEEAVATKTYSITLSVKPKDGFVWEDFTTDTKSVVITNIKANVSDASIGDKSAHTYTMEVPVELFTLAKENPEVMANDDTFLETIQDFLNRTNAIKNVTIAFQDKKTIKELDLERKEPSSVKTNDKTSIQYKLKGIAKDGHVFSDGSKEKSFTFTMVFVNNGTHLFDENE